MGAGAGVGGGETNNSARIDADKTRAEPPNPTFHLPKYFQEVFRLSNNPPPCGNAEMGSFQKRTHCITCVVASNAT